MAKTEKGRRILGANRRFKKKLKDLTEVDLGISNFNLTTFNNLFKIICGSSNTVTFKNKYKKLSTEIDTFLKLYPADKSFAPKKAVILEIFYFYVQALIPFSEQETKNRTIDRQQIGIVSSQIKNTNHISAKVHHLQELYFYVCYGAKVDLENLDNNKLLISPKKARDTIAKWSLLFDSPDNSDHQDLEGVISKRSEAIQKASKRWNVFQAPNQAIGVYLPKIEIIEIQNNGITKKVRRKIILTDKESLDKYRPKYPKI